MNLRNPMDRDVPQEAAWYVIRTVHGHESDTRTRMMGRLRGRNLAMPGMQILVPKEVIVAELEAEKYAGFVLVRMQMQPEAWKILWSTPGASGFVGAGLTPTAFPETDWMRIPFDHFSNI